MIAVGTKIKAKFDDPAYNGGYGIKEGDILVVCESPEFFEHDGSVWVKTSENPHVNWATDWKLYVELCVATNSQAFKKEWGIVE